MFTKKNLTKILINSCIGFILVFFWLKLVNLSEILHILKSTNLIVVPVFVLFFVSSTILRSWRLKLLLLRKNISLFDIVSLTFLAQFLSFTIPIRAGELAKGVYLSTHHELPFSRALVLVLLDRFIDFFGVLVLVAVLLFFIPTNLPSSVEQTLFLAISLISVGIVVTFVFPELIKKFVQYFSQILFFEKIKSIFTQFAYFGIDSIVFFRKNKSNTAKLLLLTFFAIFFDALQWLIIFASLSYFVDFTKLWLGSGLSMLTYLIPAAPGYVGSAEASGLVVFNMALGLDKGMVSAATVLLHALNFVFILAFGIIGLYLLKFDLSLVWRKLKRED